VPTTPKEVLFFGHRFWPKEFIPLLLLIPYLFGEAANLFGFFDGFRQQKMNKNSKIALSLSIVSSSC
jgi:hypothetical protein